MAKTRSKTITPAHLELSRAFQFQVKRMLEEGLKTRSYSVDEEGLTDRETVSLQVSPTQILSIMLMTLKSEEEESA